MKEIRKKACQIFEEYDRLENRLPTKQEFELEYYGEVKKESRYYYMVKRRYLTGEWYS